MRNKRIRDAKQDRATTWLREELSSSGPMDRHEATFGLPHKLLRVLGSLGHEFSTEPTWRLSYTDGKAVVYLTYFEYGAKNRELESELPKRPKRPHQTGNNQRPWKPHVEKPHVKLTRSTGIHCGVLGADASTPAKPKKKKSPSATRRDRRRLLEFRTKKATSGHPGVESTPVEPEPSLTSESRELLVVSDPKTTLESAKVSPPDQSTGPFGSEPLHPVASPASPVAVAESLDQAPVTTAPTAVPAADPIVSQRHVKVQRWLQSCMACKTPADSVQGGLKRCTSCKVAGYCGRPCQAADWKNHRSNCRDMRELASRAPPYMYI